MAFSGRWQPVAIALVIRDDDGTMHIIGSKDIRSSTFSIEEDGDPFGSFTMMRRRQTYRFEAECASAVWQQTTPAPTPPQIEQRGIYLPDMSFRALPDKKAE